MLANYHNVFDWRGKPMLIISFAQMLHAVDLQPGDCF